MPSLTVRHDSYDGRCPCPHRDGSILAWLRWFTAIVRCDKPKGYREP